MKIFILLLCTLVLAGCANGPNWQRADITDKSALSRQLKIDDGECTLVAVGAAPMPSIPSAGAQTQDITVQGRTYNPSTGTWTNSTYTGHISNGSAGSFGGGMASGFSNGMALGAAIKAQQQQDAIYAACMNAKGWLDVPVSD